MNPSVPGSLQARVATRMGDLCSVCGEPKAAGSRRPPIGCGKGKCRAKRQRNREAFFRKLRQRPTTAFRRMIDALEARFARTPFTVLDALPVAIVELSHLTAPVLERQLRELSEDAYVIRAATSSAGQLFAFIDPREAKKLARKALYGKKAGAK
ncbi:MAG: hypothetical protein U0174_03490 [Polyangiaceae bacterium]